MTATDAKADFMQNASDEQATQEKAMSELTFQIVKRDSLPTKVRFDWLPIVDAFRNLNGDDAIVLPIPQGVEPRIYQIRVRTAFVRSGLTDVLVTRLSADKSTIARFKK